MKTPLDSDRLNSVSARQAGLATMSALTRLQDSTPEAQIAGAAVLFLVLCKRFDTYPGNALRVAQNILEDTAHQTPELNAARDYAAAEL